MTRPVLSHGLWLLALLGLSANAVRAETPSPPRPMVEDGHFVMQGGEAVYQGLCAACHMPDAKGAKGAGAYPALAGDPRLAGAAYPIHVVVHGQKGMPAFGASLDDQQIADVVGYIRTHFGNAYPRPVTAEEVEAERRR